jgi:hypothetical protein
VNSPPLFEELKTNNGREMASISRLAPSCVDKFPQEAARSVVTSQHFYGRSSAELQDRMGSRLPANTGFVCHKNAE